ncbi:ribosome maturation factor RimP [Hirschia maritima]|uniref:ribosome maturation factor RimP n=1 Tax=Hirschia maritima TaxID=1121961 RepID=UPI000372667B|nr:ribosome maturation factor RimP [Hirschia maritima]
MRAISEIEKRILDIIQPEADSLGLDIVRVRMMGANTPILQIMAEKPDGTMDVEDCAKLSRAIGPVLDVEDPIPSEYNLEVSSPGIDRPLTREGDFANWVSHEARVEIGVPKDGRRRFHGTITEETNGVVSMDLKDGSQAEIAVTEMVKASLVMTDRLIEEALSRGQAPEVDDDQFDELENEENNNKANIDNSDDEAAQREDD